LHWLHTAPGVVYDIGPTLVGLGALWWAIKSNGENLRASRRMTKHTVVAAATQEHERWIRDRRADLYLDMLKKVAWDTREFRRKFEPGCAGMPQLYPLDEASEAGLTTRAMIFASRPVTEAYAAFGEVLRSCTAEASRAGPDPDPIIQHSLWPRNRQRVVDAMEKLSTTVRDELRVARENVPPDPALVTKYDR
jgi:hypothetical protein